MPNINPLKEKPQEFELIELLFPDIAKSSIPQNPPLDYSFQARFQSFINQIPSYLHSSIKEGFFPHFFLGSFSTLLDTRLGVQKIGITSLYFRFDGAKTLKVVVEIEKKVNVFIFTEEGNKKYKSEQLRTRKLEFTTDELDEINNLRANNKQSKLKEKDIKIQLIKINKSTGENKITVEIDNNIPIKRDAGPAPVKFPFQKITKKRAGDDHLENDIAKLASPTKTEVENSFKKILTYIKEVHTALGLSKDVYGSQAREADHHGFVAGVFDNFRYRENTRIYLEQFAGRGYADIILLVRGPDRATNSIPIIIELKAGITGQIGSSDALKQAKDYTKGFQPNTMRILTIPDNILCVGINLDSTASSFMQMELVKRDIEIAPLVQGILDSTREWEIMDQITREKDKSVFQDKIKEYLENTYHTFPGTGEKSENHYFSRFLLGQSILLEDDKYTKHIFIYNKDDIVATEELKVFDSQATRVQPGRIAKDKTQDSQLTDLKGDKSHAITTVLFIPSSQKDSVILLNIIETNRDVQLKKIPLNQALIGDRKIIQLDLHFRIDKKQFEEYCNIKTIDLYPSLKSYNDAYNEESKGDFTKITYPDKLKEKFADALNSQLQADISSDKYNNLLKKIGEGINPIKSLISKEAHFQAILHGAFSHYSDVKLAEEEKIRELVLTEFQTGAGGRIDMLIQGIGASVQGTKEYTPVGLELKYDDSIKLTHTQENNLLKITDIAEKIQKEQEFLNDKGKKVVKNLVDEQVNRYSQGAALKAITDSDKVVIMGVVFNAQARNADSLLLTSDSFTPAMVVHSSTTVVDPPAQIGSSQSRDTSTSDSQELRLESISSLEEARAKIGLTQLSKSSCSSSSASSSRRKREICRDNELDELFPYEPLQENIQEPTIQYNTRLYSNIAYLFSSQTLENILKNIMVDNVVNYNSNIGDIISEGEINHSIREKELLKNHYKNAEEFLSKYPKNKLLDLVSGEVNPADSHWLFDNGKHLLLISYEENYYKVYSQDYNYRVVFRTKEGVSFGNIKQFAKAFFCWRNGNEHYQIFTLSKNLPKEAVDQLKQAKFWNPDQVVSDLTLLEKGYFSQIENIPVRVVRELFFLNEQVPELSTLYEDFFKKNLGKVSLRVEAIHNVLQSVSEQESSNLVNLIKKYNFPVDENYLNTIPESNKELLQTYHNKVSNKLKQSNVITIEDLSDLSWKILEEKMAAHPDISPELKESALKNVKDLQVSTSTRMQALGVTTQTLFFLPDIIRSVNNDDYSQLGKLGGMVVGDMAFNKLYESLINKLELVVSSSRISLLKKLPVTSPIFKILTIHSIIELTDELNTLPVDSERRGIVKHLLGEQYFTLGLMVVEAFGLATGPLWIGLMVEQLVYGTIALRKEYHLDTSFEEALLLSLGFEKNKLQSILEERGLVDVNLSLIKTLSNQTQISYDFAVVKVPKVLDDVPQTANSVMEFKPYNHHSCMEDNVFLEESTGYSRISSVVDNNSGNCATKSSLHITGLGLAALYANKQLSNSTRNIVNIFDPNEGDLELKFTKEGLQELDKFDSKVLYNKTNPYIINTKILHKPYPDQIGLFGNRNHSLILSDDSKRIVSKYYIDGTIPFNVQDNTISTSIIFLNNKLIDGYNAYIKGDTSNILVDSMYPSRGTIGNISLTNKNYLKLDLKFTVIKKLSIDIPHTDLLYVKGKNPKSSGKIELKADVLNSNIILGPNIELSVNSNKDISNKRITLKTQKTTIIDQFGLVSLQVINGYKTHVIFNIDNLQPILDNINQMPNSKSFPSRFYFECLQRPIANLDFRELCALRNTDIINNVILIKGKINSLNATLTINAQSSILEVLQSQTGLKHIEEVHYYNNITMLENNSLSFKEVINPDSYKASYYHNNIIKHKMLEQWLMLKFSAGSRNDILHHFRYDNINNKVNINGIDYIVVNNRIYAVLDREIDATKLIRFDEKRTISVFVDKSLKSSTVFIEEEKVRINNITVNNLPDKTVLLFQESENNTLPVSIKFLKDSFNPTRSKREINQELENEELKTIVDQDNYNNQINTEHENINNKSNDWFSWMGLLLHNVAPDTNIVLSGTTMPLDALADAISYNISFHKRSKRSLLQDEVQADNPEGSAMTSSAATGSSWINDGVKAIKFLFNTLLQKPLLSSDEQYNESKEVIIEVIPQNTPYEYASIDSNTKKLSGNNSSNIPHIKSTHSKTPNISQSSQTESATNNTDMIVYNVEKHNNIILDNCTIGAQYGYEYVDGATCRLPDGRSKVMIFPIKPVDTCAVPMTEAQDTFKHTSCTPIEFNGQKSVYCEGEKASAIYTPIKTARLFDNIDSNLMLGRVSLHLLHKVWGWITTTTVVENKVIINDNMQKQWAHDVKNINNLLQAISQDLELHKSDTKVINHCSNILEEIQEDIDRIVTYQKSIPQTHVDSINNQLEDLAAEINDIENSYYYDSQGSDRMHTAHEETGNHDSNGYENRVPCNDLPNNCMYISKDQIITWYNELSEIQTRLANNNVAMYDCIIADIKEELVMLRINNVADKDVIDDLAAKLHFLSEDTQTQYANTYGVKMSNNVEINHFAENHPYSDSLLGNINNASEINLF